MILFMQHTGCKEMNLSKLKQSIVISICGNEVHGNPNISDELQHIPVLIDTKRYKNVMYILYCL